MARPCEMVSEVALHSVQQMSPGVLTNLKLRHGENADETPQLRRRMCLEVAEP